MVGDTPVITTDGAEPPGNKEYRQPPEHRAVQSQWRLQVPAYREVVDIKSVDQIKVGEHS